MSSSIRELQEGESFPIHTCNRAFLLDGKYHTEIIRTVYANKIVFIITQLDSLGGCIIRAEKDANSLTMTVSRNENDLFEEELPEPTYSIRTLFGKRAPSFDHPQSDTYLDIESIFARRLIEDLYQVKQPAKPTISPFGMEPVLPMPVMEKPIILCLTFSKEFQSKLKEPKVGKLVMDQLLNCVVNKL